LYRDKPLFTGRVPNRLLLLTALVALAGATSAVPARVLAQEAPPQLAGTPRLEVSTSNWNFGEKWSGEKAETTVTLRNAGDAPLKIDRVKSSCGCTVAALQKKVLEPGEAEELRISYDTRTQKETVSQKVEIHSNDPASPVTAITVTGVVRPVVRMNPPRALNFGPITRTEQVARTVDLECTYTEPVRLELEALRSDAFEARLEELEAGRRYRLHVTTKPPLPDGSLRAEVRLRTGLALLPDVTVHAWASVQPLVAAIPGTLYVTEGTDKPSERTLQVSTRRDRQLSVTGVSASVPTIQAVVLPPPDTSGAEANITRVVARVRVTLPPASELPSGGAQITIATDDPDYPQLVVPVTKRPARQAQTQPATRSEVLDPTRRALGSRPAPPEP